MKLSVKDEAAELQLKLGKKATFEDAVKKLTMLVANEYLVADLEARNAIDTAVSRVATLLQTRYSGDSSRGFWTAGATLFEAAAQVVKMGDQKKKVQKYLAKAHEFLGEDEPVQAEASFAPQPRFLFEGQLSQDPPPMRAPDAQALFSSMFGQFIGVEPDDVPMEPADEVERSPSEATSQEDQPAIAAEQQTPAETRQGTSPSSTDQASESPATDSSQPSSSSETPQTEEQTAQGGTDRQVPPEEATNREDVLELPEWAEALRAPNGGLFDQLRGDTPLDRPSIQGALQRLQEMLHAGNAAVFPGLEEALQASLEDAGQRSKQRPAAAKDEVERLPVMDVDEAKLRQFGAGTQCAVCREDLVVGDKVQQMPCNHLFHPPCLAPWLEENNSCPICRFELRTDDNEYERRKEREKEEEEDRRGAENAVREGQFMYM
ncbi:RING U-box superfamily protein [Klebsormidium nitens]|uniref:RING-type E3 ubiquitin transferase n=1 Tax=Klebsormidium nitens TaxID=105231 RepID=A0A0U9HLC9_KLENI|nr:RING U-box superfamily protein [Klebsormidium nitens]|eukprot:GAQ82494.1 RING U-box superfamily protein [Klebsormidium nitens]